MVTRRPFVQKRMSRLHAAHRVRPIGRAVEAGTVDRLWTIRAYCRVERCGWSCRRLGKRYRAPSCTNAGQPVSDSAAGLLGDLELNRPE
jgi:hypothetical protein